MASNGNTSGPWFGISMALGGLIVGYVLATGMGTGMTFGANAPAQVVPGAPAAPSAPTVAANPADVDDDPVMGDSDAPVTIVEFTDYQCPFCSRFFTQTLPELKKNYIDTGKVKLVVRDFPLSFHPFAQKAAEATECADEQGKFWEMHDALFAKQAMWSAGASVDETFAQYASDLKLNVETFKTCLSSGAMAAEVNADLAEGSAAGIDGTPGFWVIGEDGKGTQISGAQPYANFAAAIDAL